MLLVLIILKSMLDIIKYTANKYKLIVNYRNTRKSCALCLSLTIKAVETTYANLMLYAPRRS